MLIRNLLGMTCPVLEWCVLRIDVGGDAPDPDPNIGVAAREQAAIAREMVDIGRDELAFQRERAERLDPKYLEAMDLSLDSARDNRERSTEQWEQYQDVYRPIEERVAADSMKWDSGAELDRAAQEARAGVARSFSGARDINARALERSGVNPASGRYLGEADRLGLAEAAVGAGASNAARDKRRLEGLSMRENVAKFGRNMPATGIAADAAALSGAGGTAQIAGQNLAAGTVAGSSALPWMQGGVNANASSGNLLLGQHQAQMQGYAAEQSMLGGLGQGLGTGLGIWAMSSEDVKEDKEPVNATLILEGLEEMPVEAWKYKKGVGDGARHIGPYAEDVHAQFGERAAPGGDSLDLVSMNGIALAGIQALAKKVKRMEKSMGLDMAPRKKMRNTEPRRVA